MVGVILCLLVIILFQRNTPFSQLPGPGQFSLIASSISGIMQIAAGYALLKNHRWAHKISIPVSLLLLIAFPFGTLLGLYYLWFRFLSKSRKKEAKVSRNSPNTEVEK